MEDLQEKLIENIGEKNLKDYYNNTNKNLGRCRNN
jgi:hypothetical protein